MDAVDRRGVLRSLLCGVVAAGLGATLVANPVEAVPLAMQKHPGKPVDLKQEAQAVATRPRPLPHHRRHWRRHRRPRRVCWWHRGRRVCAWR